MVEHPISMSTQPIHQADGSPCTMSLTFYIKGEWQSKFEKAETKKDNFYVRRDKIRVTDFMNQKGEFNYLFTFQLFVY